MSAAIHFYLAPEQWQDPLPARYDLDWPHFGDGHYNWILQSYLLLRERGVDCALTSSMEGKSGVFIAHRRSLDEAFKPASDQFRGLPGLYITGRNPD